MTLTEPLDLVYTAQSKLAFYCRDAVCEHVLRAGRVPLNPFRVFGYFLGDRVERDAIRRGNFTLLRRADAMWVYGTKLADGVLAEVAFAHELDKPVRYFTIATRATEIREVSAEDLGFEDELFAAGWTATQLREVLVGQRPFGRAPQPA